MIYIAVLVLSKCFSKSIFFMSYDFSNRMEVLLNVINAILFLKDKYNMTNLKKNNSVNPYF